MPSHSRAFRIPGVLVVVVLGALAAVPSVTAADPTKGPPAAKMTSSQLAEHIDRAIEEKNKAEKIALSPQTGDAEFLRRVYLDLAGTVPSAEKAAAFLDNKDAGKREKLIDELLASKDFGRHMADLWQALLLPRNTETRRLLQYFPHMVGWLEEQFNTGAGWDRIARGVLTASGPVDKPGAAVYWLANPTADKATDNVTRMFMGVQLQCAQCHNHPFTNYKQNEYWHMAAFFLKVRPDGNPRMAARTGATISISETGGRPNRRMRLPDSAKRLPPKFLGGEQPKVRPSEAVRPVFADWLTSPKNPFFARAMVNRTWGQLFGRGFVQPIDDMHEGNPNSHPGLLADMSEQFAASGFDVKFLLRAICNSQAYQRSSKQTGNNAEAPPELFARMAIRPLSPEQLYDSLAQVMGGSPLRAGGPRAGGRRRSFGRVAARGFRFFVWHRGRGRPHRVSCRHSAGPSPDERSAAQSRDRDRFTASRGQRPGGDRRAALSDRSVAPAEHRGSGANRRLHAEKPRREAPGLCRRSVGADEFQRVRAEPLINPIFLLSGSARRTSQGIPSMQDTHPLTELSRRDAMKLVAAGVTGASMSGWLNVLAAGAAAQPARRPKSCILLWMAGGPSHKDTFDMKPGTKNGGPFKEIDTSAPGIRISEFFPNLAKQMHHAAILRSMSTAEGAHDRAQYHLHTGYREGQGGVVYPSLGAIVSKELGRPEFPLPSFVSIGGRVFGAGFLGSKYQPLAVANPGRGVENLKPTVATRAFDGRVDLLDEMEKAFHRDYHADASTAHRTTYQRAVQLMKSKEAKAFDLGQEPAAVRRAYGDWPIRRGLPPRSPTDRDRCLLRGSGPGRLGYAPG